VGLRYPDLYKNTDLVKTKKGFDAFWQTIGPEVSRPITKNHIFNKFFANNIFYIMF
jgi:hypothetical protein